MPRKPANPAAPAAPVAGRSPRKPAASAPPAPSAAAATPAPPPPAPAPAAPPSAAPVDRRRAVIEALMRLAAEQPWSDIEITDIAREAGVSLAQMRDLFPSKGAVLGGFSRMIDTIVLEGTSDDLDEEPARDRLFDVLMRRLDAMTPYKEGLRRVMEALRGDLLALAALNAVALNSQRYMLAAAGIGTEGPLGRLKVQGVVITFARTLETWFEDDDDSLARTMARLDREIGRGERIMERAEDVRRLTAPFRALGRGVAESVRERARGGRRRRRDEEPDVDPAAAI